jgi:hypothetical protein
MCNCYRYYPEGRHLPSCKHYVPAEVDIDLTAPECDPNDPDRS